MRIAIVGLNYAPEEIGIARYTADMARSLAARGHDVEVIAGKPYYPEWQVYAGWQGGGWRHGTEDGVRVTRCPHYVPRVPTGLKRILHLASFALSALVPGLRMALRRDARPQVVICVAPALLSVPVAWVVARLAGAKLWVHVQDFEVEAAFATGLVDGRGLAARGARGLENRLLRLADATSSISPQMCAKLAEKGVAHEAVHEIRNWADMSTVFAEAGASTYAQEWGLSGRHVALYSGNIANKQGIEVLIEAARLLQHRQDIAFVICGQGPNRARLEALADQGGAAGSGNVQFQDLQPFARMGDLLGLASVHLLPQIPGAADLVLPSKLTNMLASGRPVVATAEPGTGLYDEVDGCGILTPPGDARALADAVEALIDDAQRAAALGAQGRKRAAERWAINPIITRLEGALSALCEKVQR